MTVQTQEITELSNDLEVRAKEVERAYNKIVDKLIALHKTFQEPHLRKHVQLVDYYTSAPQFISRFIDICLSGDKQTISYGKSSNSTYEVGNVASTEMIRIIFDATAKANTSIDIEDCLDDHYFHLPAYFAALDNPQAKIYLESRQ